MLAQSLTSSATSFVATTENDETKSETSTSSEKHLVPTSYTRSNVPSFIRLFFIRHVLNTTKDWDITSLISLIKDENIQAKGQKILVELMKYGIKKYMKRLYDDHDDEQALVIEIIFKQIILHKFDKEYQRAISYRDDDNDNDNDANYYQSLVFNSSDLMCCIFQYFGIYCGYYAYSEDIHNFSLVSCQWLYHVWNPNSVYFVNLTTLIKWCFWEWSHAQAKAQAQDTECINTIENFKAPIKIWQRFSNAKSVRIELANHSMNDSIYCIPLISMMNKLSIFKNVEWLVALINEEYTELLTTILNKCKNKVNKLQIQCQRIGIDSNNNNNNDITSLHLPQVKWISISQCFKYWIKWSDKCQTLHLSMHWLNEHIENKNEFLTINKQLCQYIIDNCDCSGIKLLTLRKVQFPFLDDNKKSNIDSIELELENKNNMNVNVNNNKLILKKFVEKFTNLEYFAYHLNNNDHDNDNKLQHGLQFRKLLQPIVLKNKCKIKILSDEIVYKEIAIDEKDFNKNGIYNGKATFGSSKWYLSLTVFNNNKKHFSSCDPEGNNIVSAFDAGKFWRMAKLDVRILAHGWNMIAVNHNDPQLPKNSLSPIQFSCFFQYAFTMKKYKMQFEQCPDIIPPAIQFNVIRMYGKSKDEISKMNKNTITIEKRITKIETEGETIGVAVTAVNHEQ